jgi:hypothetical protein
MFKKAAYSRRPDENNVWCAVRVCCAHFQANYHSQSLCYSTALCFTHALCYFDVGRGGMQRVEGWGRGVYEWKKKP